jgi:hypothetical protein
LHLDEFAEVEGRVTEIRWVNPHIKILIENADETWELEAGPVNLLSRMGIASDTIAIGDRIRARGNPGRNDDQVLWVLNILAADNTELVVNPRAEPYWGSDAVGDASAFFEAGSAGADDSERSLFRVWSPLLDRVWPLRPTMASTSRSWRIVRCPACRSR